MISKDSLISILGKKLESFAVNEFKKKLLAPLVEEESLPGEKYLSCYDAGFSLLFESDELSAVHMYCCDNKYGYSEYQGWIGDGLASSLMSLKNVEFLMGEASRKGGGEKGFMGKIDSPWLRYDFPDYVIHYTFSTSGERIEMITLMPPEKKY